MPKTRHDEDPDNSDQVWDGPCLITMVNPTHTSLPPKSGNQPSLHSEQRRHLEFLQNLPRMQLNAHTQQNESAPPATGTIPHTVDTDVRNVNQPDLQAQSRPDQFTATPAN